MANRRDNQFFYTPHNRSTLLDCSFVVDPTNANGLGISSLNKSGRIGSVFMHTSQTPGSSNGQVNPNPASGIVIVTLQDNYNTVLGHSASFQDALSGTSISISTGSSLTAGNPYVITALGTTTTAQWQTVGVPSQITPAVGVSFIAAATSGTGTGTVQAPIAAGAGVDTLSLIGNPNVMNNNRAGSILGAGVGMQLVFGAYKNIVLTAPTALTTISLKIFLNNSAQGV